LEAKLFWKYKFVTKTVGLLQKQLVCRRNSWFVAETVFGLIFATELLIWLNLYIYLFIYFCY